MNKKMVNEEYPENDDNEFYCQVMEHITCEIPLSALANWWGCSVSTIYKRWKRMKGWGIIEFNVTPQIETSNWIKIMQKYRKEKNIPKNIDLDLNKFMKWFKKESE